MNEKSEWNFSELIWFLAKILITAQMTYLEQTDTQLLQHANIYYWQCYN